MNNNSIIHLDTKHLDDAPYDKRFVGCVVLTHDHKILLQQRPDQWQSYPGYQCEFGGHINDSESPTQAIIRELKEELGATVQANDLISLGAISENMTNHTQIIYVFYWHDKQNTITGCYEGTANRYDSVSDALTHPKMVDSVRWLLTECQHRGLF